MNVKKALVLGMAVGALLAPTCYANEANMPETAQAEAPMEVAEAGYNIAYTLEMEATAYLPTDGGGDGVTATGIPATYGVVAVDPDIIPLGTRLYIPGYGEAIAADTGGAIEGHMIDLCMESYDECMDFGRRDIIVHILA